ncbi:MAG: UDP-N-acetylmuramoyl-L-alanine--D-glutamate ligase [Candidatus Solibacter usitatus]|nr:UDP-N-acetylmuramoyl-L-alanine--D-glutamate ligase [Candidatus Solibacter usitatus]
MDVRGARITVFGMAKSGLAAIDLLKRQGALLRASDCRPLDQLPPPGVDFVIQSPEALADCDIAVLSPGVPPGLPIFQEAASRGVRIVGDVEAASWYLQGPILGITGSNGKTTTTALAGHLLDAAGIPCQVGGNIGRPLASMVDSSRPDQWNVLELSSFQLETSHTLRVRIAAVLNITPDHLDRHGAFDNYAAAKARILLNQAPDDSAVLNAENPAAAALARQAASRVHWFNAGGSVQPGFWRESDQLFANGHAFMPASEIRLRGRHNIENVLAAACCVHLAGAPLEAIRSGVASFAGVEHRIEFVRTVRGVDYYNDSKATNVDATLKALESFDGGLWVILGGKDKNSDYTVLRPLLEARARAVLLIGAAAEKIESHLAGSVELRHCGDLAHAVGFAASHASPAETVLLAPACASFDQFTSYEHRGRTFKELVHALEE